MELEISRCGQGAIRGSLLGDEDGWYMKLSGRSRGQMAKDNLCTAKELVLILKVKDFNKGRGIV